MNRAGVRELGRGFSGRLLHPGDDGYDAARQIWNGAIDRRPALIARCASVDDVVAAVKFGRGEQLLVAIRGGGHNVAGTAVCDGGLMIDLSPMNGIAVDLARRIARVQPGVLWGDLDREAQAFGLAVPGGIVTHTGVGGLTLGGGIGWLMRKHGLTCDSLFAADLVTADGTFVRASETEHPDLFWGIRGGGGNFGIVTSFEFQLHPVGPSVLAGLVVYPADQAEQVLRFYRDFAATSPDELTTIVTFRHAAPLPILPRHLHGAPVIVVGACYAGPIEEGERAIRPLRAFRPPLVDLIGPTAYAGHQSIFDAGVPHGLRYYWKSHYLPDLSDSVIDAITRYAWQTPSPQSYTILFQLGGAVAKRDDGETAFTGRSAGYAININAVGTDPAQDRTHERWVREFWNAMQPFSNGVYMNFLGNEGRERVRNAYGPRKYERLVALKNTYDPTNFFRLNQNIAP
jgi:FAD/FMN-containing dehydrogenase